MKRMTLCLSAGLALFAAAYAAADDAMDRDEQRLERTSADLDKDADRPEGPKEVVERLKSEFKVDDARVQGLRDRKLGFGEVAIVLALAEKRPGGITDANVSAIMAERNGPPKMGWGRIARNQGTTLGKVLSGVKRVDAAARRHERGEGRKQEMKEEKAEKAERRERTERPERAERRERTERPERSRR